ncbi:WD repeat-containing protein 91 [Diorhabda carinulata]|uniref:WD repeat-containing protein 91 n=1 Tax=Diorhabda carinulata TaxID=1163345 RepID=UPI0025A10368|nr:WD repeat-containing protein 91 [Diorhabda carinulata]
MAHAQFLDEMIREYLLYKGFGSTLKAFDAELKADKMKSFRVDKIVDQLIYFINNYDLISLRDLWGHLNRHLFSKLESHYLPSVRKLENAVLKMFLINTVFNSKPDKMNEFFVKMTPELQNQAEWKDWFVLPYIKNPEENPTFSLHFTKQWQDTLWVSVHNFLATIIQFMPIPTLMHFEDDATRISKLEERNESLKKRLILLLDRGPQSSVTPCQVEPPQHLLDDFYVIAQENNLGESQARSLRSIIKNMSSSASPILGRKESALGKRRERK